MRQKMRFLLDTDPSLVSKESLALALGMVGAVDSLAEKLGIPTPTMAVLMPDTSGNEFFFKTVPETGAE